MTSEVLAVVLDALADAGRLDVADTVLDVLDVAGLLPDLPPDDAGPAGLALGVPALVAVA